MPAAEPMSQEIVERLKELLEKATSSLVGGTLKPHVIADLLRRGAEAQVPRAREVGATNFEADGALITELLNSIHFILRTLTNLTPSVEREQSLQAIADNVEYWLKWVTRTHENEGIEVTPDTHVMLPGPDAPPYWPSVGQLGRWLLVLRAPALALPSEPPSQVPAVSLTKEYDDYLILLMLGELHANMPEDQRPMAMCDLSDEQAERALKAVHAVKRVIVTEISNSLRGQPPSQGDVEGRAREAWQPIETAPEWDGKSGPFIDVTWAGVVHRYLPVPRRETDCFCENGVIMRKHGYPSMLTVFDPQPTHWMPSPPLASKEDARS